MQNENIATKKTMEQLPILPLVDNVPFPSIIMPLSIQDENHIKLIDSIAGGEKILALIAAKKDSEEITDFNHIYEVGVKGSILKLLRFPDGTLRMLVKCLSRIRLANRIESEPYMVGEFVEIQDYRVKNDEETALIRAVISQFTDVAKMAPYLPDELPTESLPKEDPARLVDAITAAINIDLEKKQSLLEEPYVTERLRKLESYLSKELSVLRITNEIQSKATKNIEKGQKEYLLREQIKAIKKELGEEDGKEIEELQDKIDAKELPEEARRAAEHELERLQHINPASAEYSVSLTYIDWILKIPWMESTQDSLDVNAAKEILDEDHYDLDKVKQRILEFIAVRKLKPDSKSPILLFVGPPGVGKTSLGRSIARAMNREFFRMSLGGMRDEAEIRGHRRTYIGALPGRIVQGMSRCGSNNPVFMLDEVDKIGKDFRGDPSSALLEVLDPEQNDTFTDHYLEVPLDLSRVMFIATANYIDPIPRVLLDRMEMIKLPGYTRKEKLGIAKNYLVEKQQEAHGLSPSTITFDDEGLLSIIDDYTREAGVRNLDRTIASICRKVAKEIAAKERDSARITRKRVRDYLGPQFYLREPLPAKMLPGISVGLAWTPVGGEILVVEASAMPGNKTLTLTGHLGDVMKESAQTALSWLRTKAEELNIDKDFNKLDIHLHVPAGAIPKDGPSAGIAMASALVSLFTGTPLKKATGMTGEITLRGEVLPIGGIKEKTLAAYQAGVRRIILPEENQKDMEEIPEEIKEEIEFIFVENMNQVIENALD